MSINNSGALFGVKATLGGPLLGQGYFICRDGIGTDFGTYPNENFTILSNLFIRGSINDSGSAVVDNIFFKNILPTPTPTPTATPTPTPTLTNTPTPLTPQGQIVKEIVRLKQKNLLQNFFCTVGISHFCD